MFTFIYLLLVIILYILAIPYLLFKSTKKKYFKSIPAKFFLINNIRFKNNGIWFHTCSQGETQALKPIFDRLHKNDINLTTITNTGHKKGLDLGVTTRYLPFEIFLPFWITKQKILLVMEAELWYMLFFTAFKNNTKTVLINARINDKSYKNYLKFRFFYKQIFKYIDKIFAQSEEDKKRLESLGAKNITVIGNIKLANLPKTTKSLDKPNDTLITAGSTHKGEEELILNSWNISYGKLVIVPRHPERFDEVVAMVTKRYNNSTTTYSRYSVSNNFDADITIVDMMGELNNIYAISDVVILGGGFIETAGGHNPIEPAFFNTVVISGKIIFNQKSLFEATNDCYLIENNELENYLKKIPSLKKASLSKIGTIEPIVNYINKIKEK